MLPSLEPMMSTWTYKAIKMEEHSSEKGHVLETQSEKASENISDEEENL